MTIEDAIRKAIKLQAIADDERGDKGPRDNAKLILSRLMEEHGITHSMIVKPPPGPDFFEAQGVPSSIDEALVREAVAMYIQWINEVLDVEHVHRVGPFFFYHHKRSA